MAHTFRCVWRTIRIARLDGKPMAVFPQNSAHTESGGSDNIGYVYPVPLVGTELISLHRLFTCIGLCKATYAYAEAGVGV